MFVFDWSSHEATKFDTTTNTVRRSVLMVPVDEKGKRLRPHLHSPFPAATRNTSSRGRHGSLCLQLCLDTK